MKPMARPKLPDSERKVRVVIYAKAEHVLIARAVARDRDMDLSKFTEKMYEKARRFHRTENAEMVRT